ncbi:hypothetical protein [Brevundimonas sp. FT23028]|uniref:hypothetical protein n=1 Tax=Brevundimonas sp. FT23028 TaxID=3393748 RepID=UPI003B58AE12
MDDLTNKLIDLSPAQRALDTWPLPKGEPISGKTYMADGYVYRDLPRMTKDLMAEFVSIVGEAEIVWLTLADYGETTRGQILISPAGQANLSAHMKANTQ